MREIKRERIMREMEREREMHIRMIWHWLETNKSSLYQNVRNVHCKKSYIFLHGHRGGTMGG